MQEIYVNLEKKNLLQFINGDNIYSGGFYGIYLQKLLKVSDTLSTLNENFNAGIKLFQNSNCFILNHDTCISRHDEFKIKKNRKK